MGTYGSESFVESISYNMPDMPEDRLDSSLVLAYYKELDFNPPSWHPIPGIGPGGIYGTSYFLYQFDVGGDAYDLLASTYIIDGSPNYTKTWTDFRIFVIPASTIIPGGRISEANIDIYNLNIDFKDHDAVCEFFNLPKN